MIQIKFFFTDIDIVSRGEETKYQVEVREEMGQLEAALLTTKRDYELLRIEFERTVASNEQAAPIARELQVSSSSVCVYMMFGHVRVKIKSAFFKKVWMVCPFPR